jgi:hypothetical protein
MQIHSSRSSPIDRPPQSALRFPPPVANRPTTCAGRRHTRSFIGRFTVVQLVVGPARSQSTSSPAALNPHSACGAPLSSLSAVSFLGGFRTPAAGLAARALNPAHKQTSAERPPRKMAGYCLAAAHPPRLWWKAGLSQPVNQVLQVFGAFENGYLLLGAADTVSWIQAQNLACLCTSIFHSS